MAKKLKNEIGKVYGKLTVIKETAPHVYPSGRPRRMFLCRCECGNEKPIMIVNLKSGGSKSCGCVTTIRVSKLKYTHGLSKHPLRGKWSNIKNRCNNPNSEFYLNYGGKGIKVCDEWSNDFKVFYDWCISNGWRKDLSIERKDINKGYCPENCCFIPLKDQAHNRTDTIWIDICGTRKNATQWARELNINPSMVHQRLHKGATPFEALGIW